MTPAARTNAPIEFPLTTTAALPETVGAEVDDSVPLADPEPDPDPDPEPEPEPEPEPPVPVLLGLVEFPAG